jgi:hypothetical protein
MQPAAAVEQFKRDTARKLEHVRCPEHRQPPRLRFHGRTLRDISIQMSGCCSRLLELANRAIAARQP